MKKNKKHLIILSAPSGGGKTTVAKHLLKTFPQLKFSVSATTRKKRIIEEDGKDYYFLSHEEFKKKIQNDEFIEFEKIYDDYYGTLRTEVENKLKSGEYILFDIDVKGAISLQKAFPDEAVLIFITPLNLEILEQRLRNRLTENEAELTKRLERAKQEMEFAPKFEFIIYNVELEELLKKAESIVNEFL